jgi:hypothetical protein
MSASVSEPDLSCDVQNACRTGSIYELGTHTGTVLTSQLTNNANDCRFSDF